MSRYERAWNLLEDTIWYLSRVAEDTEERQKVLQGLEQVWDIFEDCRDEVCYRCGADRHATPDWCKDCCWR